jgi:hypothetical protein
VKIPPGESKTFRMQFRITKSIAPGKYFPYVSTLLDGVTGMGVGAVSFSVT